MKRLFLTCCLLLPFNVPALASMIIRDFQAARHERFYAGADKAFIGAAYDFSGVGQATSGQWATLVSANYFISATHSHPGVGSNVTFWETNSLTAPSHSYTVTGGMQVGGSDLWVGWFGVAVDDKVERYPVLELPSPTDYLGRVQINYGIDHRVGLNVTEDFGIVTVPPVSGATGFVWAADYNNDDTPSVGGDETFLQSGDSGGPTFNVAGGRLALIGIHWAISDDPPDTNEGRFFVDSAVPAYITEINNVLAYQQQSLLVAIPEPSSHLWLCCILALGCVTARRRQHRRRIPFA